MCEYINGTIIQEDFSMKKMFLFFHCLLDRGRFNVVQRRFSVSVIHIIYLSGRVFIVYPLTKTLLYSRIIETTI